MSPDLSSGDARAVLTWGGTKPDMDLFFVGSGNCRVSYRDTSCTEGTGTITLNRDSSTGWGPDTITASAGLPCSDNVLTVVDSNVPGFFGVGTALQYYEDKGQFDKVKRLYNSSSFFKTLVENKKKEF